jgi:hypothetical protein
LVPAKNQNSEDEQEGGYEDDGRGEDGRRVTIRGQFINHNDELDDENPIK